MFITSKLFVASVTFLGCWFLHASSTSRGSRIPDQGSLFGRVGVLGILICGTIDLAISAAMWCRELGTVAGLTAWGFVGLASWTLIGLFVDHARPQGPRWRPHAAHPSSRSSEGEAPRSRGRLAIGEDSKLVAIYLLIAAILAFFKQLIETWNNE